jgi:tryptophan-rich sensory protein
MSYSTADTDRSRRGSARGRAAGRSAAVLALFLLLVTAIAAFEAVTTGSSATGWFRGSPQVVWTPAQGLSRTCWAGLFLFTALAGWLTWRRRPFRERPQALALYAVDLGLIALWPPTYLNGYPVVGVSALWLAFVIALLLVASVSMTIAHFWSASRSAAILLIPVVGWVVFIATVNVGDAVLSTLG